MPTPHGPACGWTGRHRADCLAMVVGRDQAVRGVSRSFMKRRKKTRACPRQRWLGITEEPLHPLPYEEGRKRYRAMKALLTAMLF